MIKQKMKEYDKAVENDSDVYELEQDIKRTTKDFTALKKLWKWRRKEWCEDIIDVPPFYLERHKEHPEYNYNKEHYHIETKVPWFSQCDIQYLVEEILDLDLDQYISPKGNHCHFLEDGKTMREVVKKLNELFDWGNDIK